MGISTSTKTAIRTVISRSGRLRDESTAPKTPLWWEQIVDVAVYTFGGQQIERRRIGAGTTRIPLPAGFYIITLGGTGHKVIVK